MSEREQEIINLLRTNAEFKAYMEQLVKEYTTKECEDGYVKRT